MTDNEIIKALKCCTGENCESCPAYTPDEKCVRITLEESLNLINRQQAEIERLEKQLNSKYKWENMLDKKIKEVKSEAIKELMFNLDNEISTYSSAGHDLNVYAWLKNYTKERLGEG